MKIKAIGRYAYDLLRGHQQQIEKNQYEEHLDQQLMAEQEKLAQRTTGGYINPYQNNPYQGMGQAQSALGAMNTQGMGNVFYGGGGGGGSLGVAMGGGQFNPLPAPDLEAGAWAAAISELENLWLVKFGSKWVHAPELDEFYQVACERLIKVKKMESHHITSISTPVYRIIE
jgi:hypothetical protein